MYRSMLKILCNFTHTHIINSVDFVVSAPLSRDGSESGTIYLYLGAGHSVLVSDEYTQVCFIMHACIITFTQFTCLI